MYNGKGGELTCREDFYLYREPLTGDIMAFCVIDDLMDQKRQEERLQEMEAEWKENQMRACFSLAMPHFLCNALGSIQEILLEHPRYASSLIGDLIVHLRGCIQAVRNGSLISFHQELDQIKAYVNIEKMRFGGKLKVCYDIETDGFSVPPLSIQPLVENAICHGIFGRGTAGGMVTIRTREKQGFWMTEIADDGIGFHMDTGKGQAGRPCPCSTTLESVMFRIEKAVHGTVQIESTVGIGTRVTVLIPKEKNV